MCPLGSVSRSVQRESVQSSNSSRAEEAAAKAALLWRGRISTTNSRSLSSDYTGACSSPRRNICGDNLNMGIRSRISSSDYARLRASFDGNEPIMTGGMGVSAMRQPARTYQTPEWVNNDRKVADFIHRMFPRAGKFGDKCQCDPCSRPYCRLDRSDCRCRYCRDTMKAARWMTVVLLPSKTGHLN